MSGKKDNAYWDRVRFIAKELGSDGCTCVPDFHKECCWEHDIAYRTHATIDGKPISKEQADLDFKHCIQSRSWLGRWSPLAWWRYWAVKRFGRKAWDK